MIYVKRKCVTYTVRYTHLYVICTNRLTFGSTNFASAIQRADCALEMRSVAARSASHIGRPFLFFDSRTAIVASGSFYFDLAQKQTQLSRESLSAESRK